MNTVKRALKSIKYNFRNVICSLFPMRKEIILESNPDLACNTFELYRYMLSKNLNERIKLTWLVSNPQKYKKSAPYNVDFIEINPHNKKEELQKYFRCNRAKMLITCNRYYQKPYTAEKQINIYILHGSPVKNIKARTEPLYCDYLISQAEFFNKHISEKFIVDIKQVVDTGFPRNDQLFRENTNLEKIYPDIHSFDKVIAWVPTFRKHKNKTRIDCDFDFPLGLPILYSEEDVYDLNEFLKEKNCLIIYKPHPVQDLSIIKDLNCSNLRFLYNEELLGNGVQVNEFLSQTDAMIGDYSGIYYDYLLLDRPIGITLDDYNRFEEQSGMVYGMDSDVFVGDYIYSVDDLKAFIDRVSNGIDLKINDRQKIKKLTNKYIGVGATKDLYEFLLSKYRERFPKDNI